MELITTHRRRRSTLYIPAEFLDNLLRVTSNFARKVDSVDASNDQCVSLHWVGAGERRATINTQFRIWISISAGIESHLQHMHKHVQQEHTSERYIQK